MSAQCELWHSGRTALVAGASRGIGLAIAEELLRRGAHVIMLARSAERLEAAARRITAEHSLESPGKVTTIAGDAGDPEAVSAVARTGLPVDLFIYNAAGFAKYNYLENVPPGEADAALATSLRAALAWTGALAPRMKARRFGRIVYISSVAAAFGAAGQAAYSAAKAGLGGLARAVACESAKYHITCNVLELGLVATERVREAVSDRAQKQIIARVPAGRAGEPGDVASVVSFLCSPYAGYVTGATIPVSGGLGLGILPFQTEGESEHR